MGDRGRAPGAPLSRFCLLVMVNTRTGEHRDYFAHTVAVHERTDYGRQLVANDVEDLDPAEWIYCGVRPAAPPSKI